ncbi:hypothetical protein MSG28_010586 [Choristoneura fumiferana]|uniref:Uncharacterized protein n=1 Tax=Choristoneura fumiferana TaxID=7141 RepID=A0ACC0KNG2_CHOFU|nr:hypothetical protein MSG28_010586 [Choristoneura fumiferana]
MTRNLAFVVAVALLSLVVCKPLDDTKATDERVHHLWKRFINTALASGQFYESGLSKLRTKREAGDECEKLQLCKLHARSSSGNFLAAYELYFVNKENAKLWDHHSHADCERRFAGCYGGAEPTPKKKTFRNDYDDYNY